MTVINDSAKAQALAQELSTLLDKGAITPVDPLLQPAGLYSTYFLVGKKDGGVRPILDLRGRNRYLKFLPFHMLTSADVMHVIRQGEWFTSIDLKDAYFHHQPFLRFAFQGHHYHFRVLPSGLSLSPRVFTRCVAAALAPLQAGGMKVLPYLDDWLVCAPSRAQVVQDTARLLTHVARLGLVVNVAKSRLVPTQWAAYLGLVLDSVVMRAYLSERRVDDILQLLLLFRRGKRLPFVMFLWLLGKLTAASTAIPSGLLSLRPLQMWLNGFRLDPKLHRCRLIAVSQACIRALEGPGIPAGGCAPGCYSILSGDRHIGCIPLRMGCGLAWQAGSGTVVCPGPRIPHQCAGAAGRPSGSQALSTTPAGETC